MNRYSTLAIAVLALLTLALPLRGDYPQPSPYPISWELTLDHAKPKRIVVQTPGEDNPKAYWYVTYHVVNNTDQDKVPFYPTFDMLTEEGDVIRSDNNIPPAVFDAIKVKERIKYLKSAIEVGGDLSQGEDQSRDGVAIWQEPKLHMGTFSIFVSGFWGESAVVKVGDQDVTLHKTLQLDYHQTIDELNPGQSSLTELNSTFIMR